MLFISSDTFHFKLFCLVILFTIVFTFPFLVTKYQLGHSWMYFLLDFRSLRRSFCTKKNMRGGDHPYPSRCTTCNLERYWRKTASKIFLCGLFEITNNFYPTRGTTTINCNVYCVVIFTNKNSNMLNLIICDAYHCQHTLTLSWRRPLSYRNQSIDLLRKPMDWFLFDNGLRHERVNQYISVWSLWYRVYFFPGRQLLLTPKQFKSQSWT